MSKDKGNIFTESMAKKLPVAKYSDYQDETSEEEFKRDDVQSSLESPHFSRAAAEETKQAQDTAD